MFPKPLPTYANRAATRDIATKDVSQAFSPHMPREREQLETATKSVSKERAGTCEITINYALQALMP